MPQWAAQANGASVSFFYPPRVRIGFHGQVLLGSDQQAGRAMGGSGAGIDRMQLGINRLAALLGKRTAWMEAASRGYRNGIWGFSGKSLGGPMLAGIAWRNGGYQSLGVGM